MPCINKSFLVIQSPPQAVEQSKQWKQLDLVKISPLITWTWSMGAGYHAWVECVVEGMALGSGSSLPGSWSPGWQNLARLVGSPHLSLLPRQGRQTCLGSLSGWRPSLTPIVLDIS